MAIDPPVPDPERERLLALLEFSRRRVLRAGEKLDAAQEAHRLAVDQWQADEKALRQYDLDHPAEQPDLF